MASLWLVCFVETDSSIVQATVQDLKDCGFDCWETSIGGPGVQQHSPLSVKEEVLEILNRYWDCGWTKGQFFCLPQDLKVCSTNEVSHVEQGKFHRVVLDRTSCVFLTEKQSNPVETNNNTTVSLTNYWYLFRTVGKWLKGTIICTERFVH